MTEFQGSGKQTSKVPAGYLSAGNIEICHIICVTRIDIYHVGHGPAKMERIVANLG